MHTNESIEKEIIKVFEGKNPAEISRDRIEKMGKEELTDLFYEAVQLLGVTMNKGGFEDELDAMVTMCMVLDLIFETHDQEKFLSHATTRQEGSA